MFTLPIRIALGAAAILVIVLAALFVLQIGPFQRGPSKAAKALPKVEAKVENTQAKVDASTAKADAKTKAGNADLQKRTEDHVDKIRAAPAGVSDREFYRSVCLTEFYARSAECRGFRR